MADEPIPTFEEYKAQQAAKIPTFSQYKSDEPKRALARSKETGGYDPTTKTNIVTSTDMGGLPFEGPLYAGPDTPGDVRTSLGILASMIPGEALEAAGGAGGLLSKFAPNVTGKMATFLKGLIHGGTAATVPMVSNAVEGKPVAQDLSSPANLLGIGASMASPLIEGGLSNLLKRSPAIQGADFQTSLANTIGSTPQELATANPTSFTNPVQTRLQTLSNVSGDINDLHLSSLNKQEALNKAKTEYSLALGEQNSQLVSQKQAEVTQLTSELGEAKLKSAQNLKTSVIAQNTLQRKLDEIEALPNSDPTKTAQQKLIESQLTEAKRITSEAKASQKLHETSLSTGLAEARQEPIKVDVTKLPETETLRSAKAAVDEVNLDISRRKILGAKLGIDLDPEKFNDWVKNPINVQNAITTGGPEVVPGLQKGIVSSLLQNSLKDGKLNPSAFRAQFLNPNVRQTFGVLFGPDSGQLDQKVNEVATILENAPKKQLVERFVNYAGNHVGFLALGASVAALTTSHFTGIENVAKEALAAGAGIAVVKSADSVIQKLLMDDALRKSALVWATGSTVGDTLPKASRLWLSYMNNVQPAMRSQTQVASGQ